MNTEEKLEKIKELADAMYYATQYLTTDASSLHKAMDEYHQFIVNEYHKEEPVNEDLEEAAKRYVDERMALLNPDVADMSCDRDTKMSFDVFDGSEVEAAFYEGAQWQKQQIMKGSIDGEIRFGTVKVQKEDIKEAVKGLREGEKVKLIVIKK